MTDLDRIRTKEDELQTLRDLNTRLLDAGRALVKAWLSGEPVEVVNDAAFDLEALIAEADEAGRE